ncbi:MAG: hypothetical protein NZM11_10975 [Anaerolineales bacterium]|nr:hypothetical protein [Anaerolineales bacterium]MDW8328348.1 hypothetical protein [Anaerolineales bacterium]
MLCWLWPGSAVGVRLGVGGMVGVLLAVGVGIAVLRLPSEVLAQGQVISR